MDQTDSEIDPADLDGPDEDAPHPFLPRLLDSGDPTLVCRRCDAWFDAPQHQEE